MKKKESRYFLFLIFFFWLPVLNSSAQTIEQAYDLRFQKSGNFSTHGPPYGFWRDSTQATDKGFHPLQLRYTNTKKSIIGKDTTIHKWGDECYLLWSKTVVLPMNTNKKECCTVTLNYKSELKGIRFIITAKDITENALYVDSIILPATTQWTDYSFSFCSTKARAVNIILSRAGCNDQDEGRSIYLNQVKIKLGNQEVNNLPLTSLVDNNNIQLETRSLVPLSLQDDTSLTGIQEWKDKKIVALGAAISGMEDVLQAQIQFTKHLITSENCKLVMLELPEDLCLRWNLYLQGKWSEEHEGKLMKELKISFSNPESWFEFFQWIRQYNTTAIDPVRVVGIKKPTTFSECLIDYLLTFSSNQQDSIYFLTALDRKNHSQFKKYILQSQITETVNKKDLDYFLFLIDEYALIPVLLFSESAWSEARRIQQVLDIYSPSVEKAVIIADSKRINKYFPIFDTMGEEILKTTQVKSDSLGHYLYKRYGRQYHAISFQIGERTCLLDSSYYDNYPVDWTLPFPFAFEQAGRDSGIPYFYYPSNQLPEAILGLNLFMRLDKYTLPFRYCHIPSHFDALVFISKANSIRDINDYYNNYKWYDYLKTVLDIN